MQTEAEAFFNIEVTHGGQVRNVSLLATVLNEDQKMERDRLLVKMAGSTPYDDLPTASKVRLFALATVRTSLKDIPVWFNDLLGRHENLTLSIFSEVDALERRFFQGHLEEGTTEEERPPFQVIVQGRPKAP